MQGMPCTTLTLLTLLSAMTASSVIDTPIVELMQALQAVRKQLPCRGRACDATTVKSYSIRDTIRKRPPHNPNFGRHINKLIGVTNYPFPEGALAVN